MGGGGGRGGLLRLRAIEREGGGDRRRTPRTALAEDALASDDLAHYVAHPVDDERRLVLVRVVFDGRPARDRDELGLRERGRERGEGALEMLACGLAGRPTDGIGA